MRLLIAPDKFKGSMSAGTVARILGEKVAAAGFEISEMPIADGGEGTTEVLCEVLGGKMVEIEVSDAMGTPVVASYALAGETAVIEMSAASGLWRIPEANRNPWLASTFGTGEMLRDAISEKKAKRVVIGIGGSATNDGGAGMARALGYRFFDRDSADVTRLPQELDRVETIRFEGDSKFPKIEVACDVDNPLLGENGATRVYGQQKGVKETDFSGFENRLAALANLAERDLGKSPTLKEQPGAGAAGGLGFGLTAFCDAVLRPGFDLIADLIGLEQAVAGCDVVITGEGKLDTQTLNGKGPHGLAQMAHRAGKPIIAVVGDSDDSSEISDEFDLIIKIRDPELSIAESMEKGSELLAADAVLETICDFLNNIGRK
ncbi:UNVERIFIED_CONTAM: hypothetical protein GTU68_059629 [Idotea baltica]|nr:hypothetical protein [Idotea baltica]